MGNHSMSATGGTGSGYHAKIVIDQAGYYTVSCGTGGVSYGAGRGGNAQSQPTNGGASALVRKADSKTIVSAGGGTKGQTWINGGSAGSAGVLNKMSGLVEDTVYVSTNGKNGSYKQTENSNTVNGQNGPISGKTWGSTGMANGSPGGGRVGAAHHGFVYLKFVEKLPDMYTFTINPTPSDATVQLTVAGTTYTQSSIEVTDGTTVSWSVSKTGYTTQTGSAVVTEDITENVVLEESGPLYRCYLFSGVLYFYAKDNAVVNDKMYFTSGSWGGKATSSSQMTIENSYTITAINEESVTVNNQGSILNGVRKTEDDLYT